MSANPGRRSFPADVCTVPADLRFVGGGGSAFSKVMEVERVNGDLEGDQRICVDGTDTDRSSTGGALLQAPSESSRIRGFEGPENDSSLDAWLMESVVRFRDGQAAPPQESDNIVSAACAPGDLEEDYKELSLLRIPSAEGEEALERVRSDSGVKRISNFIKNAGERNAAPQGWEDMPWAVAWGDIELNRDMENRIWTSKTATYWRAHMKKTRTREGGRIALKQIYTDKHAEVSRCRVAVHIRPHPCACVCAREHACAQTRKCSIAWRR
jgi:hypothetical protein